MSTAPVQRALRGALLMQEQVLQIYWLSFHVVDAADDHPSRRLE
jgi:hypothetical protein